MQRWDRQDRVSVRPCQSAEARQQASVSLQECLTAAWATEASGRRHRGAAAINLALAYAWRTRLPLHLYSIPGVGWLQDGIYWLIARVRSILPGVKPYCLRYPERCDQVKSQTTGPRG